jgi:hypothetical protein
MSTFLEQSLTIFQLARDWFFAQPLTVQVIAGAAGLTVLWILLRVILVAFRAAFRGL